MANGRVKSLTDRGFGFIEPEGGGEDIFFHRSALVGVEYEALRLGQGVAYDVGRDPRNPTRLRATKVEVQAG